MLRINQVKCKPGDPESMIVKRMCQIYGILPDQIERVHIVRQSIDARKKPEIYMIYTLSVELKNQSLEQKLLKKFDRTKVSMDDTKTYVFPKAGTEAMGYRPIIIGTGPAGLFCGYYLAKNGYRPILLERGKKVTERTQDVQNFWENGKLLTSSNVQFGEGGAGTFSDGKLNTLVKDKYGRNLEVLKTLVRFGAKEEIIYQAKPHIGTDVLAYVVENMRKEILALGGDVRFETCMDDLQLDASGRVCSIHTSVGDEIATNVLVLATGHSARDTFALLEQKGLEMEAKPFAVGFRVRHEQRFIDRSQYGTTDVQDLGAAPYKVTAKTTVGRGVYSFCMCPGGYVVNASSEDGMTAVNGMSYSGRDGRYANSAIVVSVSPDDYPGEGPLKGVRFQRDLEQKAFALGNGKIPMESYGDFKHTVMDGAYPSLNKEIDADGVKGQIQYADLTQIMTPEMNQAFVEGMTVFGSQIKGFDDPDVMLFGVESRTSSPVRMVRDEESLESNICGIYPCGEGAGYAGGITSAAMDGIKIAERIAARFAPPSL